jgi:hypothetical protein
MCLEDMLEALKGRTLERVELGVETFCMRSTDDDQKRATMPPLMAWMGRTCSHAGPRKKPSRQMTLSNSKPLACAFLPTLHLTDH